MFIVSNIFFMCLTKNLIFLMVNLLINYNGKFANKFQQRESSSSIKKIHFNFKSSGKFDVIANEIISLDIFRGR